MAQSANSSSPVTVQGVSGGEPVPVSGSVAATTPVPAAAEVIAGHLAHTATTAAATIITVAAGKTWMGTVSICCDSSTAAATATAGQALGIVATAGTGVTPSAGTYLSCEARNGANAATGTVGSQGANSVTIQDFVIIAPVGNAVTLTGDSTIAGTAGRVSYSANGVYIA